MSICCYSKKNRLKFTFDHSNTKQATKSHLIGANLDIFFKLHSLQHNYEIDVIWLHYININKTIKQWWQIGWYANCYLTSIKMFNLRNEFKPKRICSSSIEARRIHSFVNWALTHIAFNWLFRPFQSPWFNSEHVNFDVLVVFFLTSFFCFARSSLRCNRQHFILTGKKKSESTISCQQIACNN